MSNYTLITDLTGQEGQTQPQISSSNQDQFEMLKKYLIDESDVEDENENEIEEDDDETPSKVDWMHVYGIIMVMLLAIIIFFLYKIHYDIRANSTI